MTDNPTTNSDDELVAVPRWVLGVLSEELAGHTMCGGPRYQDGCPRCDAIRIAQEALNV